MSWLEDLLARVAYGQSLLGEVSQIIADSGYFYCAGLTGFGDDYFKGYSVYVVFDAGAAGAAPQGERQPCVNYVSATGLFALAPFSTPIAVGDHVLLMHPSAVEAEEANSKLDASPVAVPFFHTTATAQGATIVLFALDALKDTIRNVSVEFWLAADGAVTDVTPSLHKTRAGDRVTFVQEAVPAITPLVQPELAAAGRYRYPCGDLSEGQKGEFRVAQSADGGATIAIDGIMFADMML